MPFGLGIWEILILAGVLVLLFGSKGAPGMARRLGVGIRELKDSVSDLDPRTVFDEPSEPRKPAPKPAIEAAPAVPVVAAAPASETVVDAEAEVVAASDDDA